MSSLKQEHAVSVENLTKRFGDFAAVNAISLNIPTGCIYGILGPNGAGKSTIIKMIAGLLRADTGSIKIFGESMAGNVGYSIGLCPQELVIWEGLTVNEQLVFMAQMHDVSNAIAQKRAMRLLDAMALSDKKNKLADTLSGGMKRRLNILLGMMHDPQILILDEPQAGLDPQSRILVREYIKSLAHHKTVIITTHDMEEADKMIERIAIIDGGKILVEDTPDHLKKSVFPDELLEITIADITVIDMNAQNALRRISKSLSIQGNTIRAISKAPFDLVKQIENVLSDREMPMEDVKIRKGTLEDVFISLTGRGLRD